MKVDPRKEFETFTNSVFDGQYTTSGVDAYRDGDTYVVEFEIPGFNASDIDVTVHNGVLTVSAERQASARQDVQWILSGRSRGNFARSVRLGNHLDTDAVSASYNAGVLTVQVPLLASSKPRKISVESVEGSAVTLN